LGKKELEMAGELIERMGDHWDPAKYTDDYQHALHALIEQKIKSGGRVPARASPVEGRSTKVIDLVSVLQESLAQAGKGAKKSKSGAKEKRAEKRAYKKAA
jgi:DNA end-binding protein Ku